MKKSLLASFILFVFVSLASAGPTDILVKGKIFEGNDVLRNVQVSVNMAHSEYKSYKSIDGEFDFQLPFGYDYYIHFSKPGYVSKRILVKGDKIVKSMVPEDQIFKPWKVRLFKAEQGKDYSDYDDVLGEMFFDFNQRKFDWSVNQDMLITDLTEDDLNAKRERVDAVLSDLNRREVREAKVTDSRAYQIMTNGRAFHSDMRTGRPMMNFSEVIDVDGRRILIEERQEGAKSIELRTIELDGCVTQYMKVKHAWGGEYFFRNGKMINAHIYHIEACKRLIGE